MIPKVLIGCFGSSDILKAHKASAVLMKTDLHCSMSAMIERCMDPRRTYQQDAVLDRCAVRIPS